MPIDPTGFEPSPADAYSVGKAGDGVQIGRPSKLAIASLRRFRASLSHSALFSRALIAVLGLITAVSFVTMLLPPAPGAGSIDPNWQQAYAHFFTHGFQCGKDYTFTYGPLAPLIMQVYDRDLFLATYLVGLGLTAALAWIFLRYGAGVSPPRMRIYFLATVAGTLALRPDLPDCVLSFAVVIAFVSLTTGNRRISTVGQIAFTFFLAALSLYKLTLLLLSVVAVILLGLDLLTRRKPGVAFVVCASYVASCTAGWLLLGQSLANVPPFLAAARELTLGYLEAMSVGGHGHRLLCGVIGLVLFVAGLAPATRRELRHLAEPRQLRVLCLVAAAMYLNWKHAFTRIDSGHLRDFFWFCLAVVFVPAVALPAYDWSNRFRLLALRACWGLSLVSWMTLAAPRAEILSIGTTAWKNFASRIHYVVNPISIRSQMEQSRRELVAQWSLPRIKAQIGGRSVDLISYDQGLLFLNDLNWSPRPVFQSYSAYTPRLLEANADFFKGARAPEFVILTCETIDERLPSMDDGLALQEILWRYEPVLTERLQDHSYLLLKRRPTAEQRHPEVVLERKIHFGEDVACGQDAADCQSIALKIELSALGRLRKLVYQAPPIRLHVRTARGQTLTFRVVRGMIENGLLLNPLLLDDPDLLDFFSRDRGNRVTSFWLTCRLPSCYQEQIGLTVTKYRKPSSAQRSREELHRITAN